MDLHFITSNRGKIEYLYNALLGVDINILSRNLNITEIQSDSFEEVSKDKAIKAFNILKKPLVVEDGGICLNVCNGLPGVFTKYVIKRLGIEGILKLLEGKDRKACLVSVATYVDNNGDIKQFSNKTNIEISETISTVESPVAWSSLWRIANIKKLNKPLVELNSEELKQFYRSGLGDFANWLRQQRTK